MKKVKQYDLALLDDEKDQEVISINNDNNVLNNNVKNNDVLEAYPFENNQQVQPQQNNYYPQQPQYNQYPNGYYPANNVVYNNYYPQQPQYQNQPVNNNYYQGYPNQNDQYYNQNNYMNGYNQPQGNYVPYNQPVYNNAPQGYGVPNIPNNNAQSTLLNNNNGFNQHKDVKAEKEYLLKQALIKNPFLFDDFTDNKYINSIEDFFVSYKKEEYKIGDLVRKKDVRRKKKKKIFKEAFKGWKEEVEKRIEDDALVGAGQFDNSERTKNEIVKVRFWAFFLSLISLILALIMVGGKISLMSVSAVGKVEFLNKISYYEFVAYNLIIPLAIGIIILCVVLNIQARSFGKITKYAKSQYKKKLSSIKKSFSKKYSQTMKYYRTSYTGNFKKEPLPISKTAIGTEVFMEVENLVTSTSQRTSVENKKNNSYKFIRFIIRFSVFLISFITISDALVHLVASLINMLLKK